MDGEHKQKHVSLVDEATRKPAFPWPVLGWSLGSVAAAAILVVIGVQTLGSHPAQPSQPNAIPVAPTPTAPSPQPADSSPALETPVQLADLALPPFEPSNLRGTGEEAHFEDGMNAYMRGDCKSALAALALVPAQDKRSLAAQFYSAACQMHQGDLTASATRFGKIVFLGGSPYQESALYYLAQIDLARNEPAKADLYLERTIALQGVFERRARAQENRVHAFEQSHAAGLSDGIAK